MAANDELKVRCPSCGSKYKVPANAVGQKLRCSKCQTAFRVTDPRADSHRSPSPGAPSSPPRPTPEPGPGREADLKRPPTEEDILRWLSEADDDADRERRVEMSVERPHVAPLQQPHIEAPAAPRLRIARDDTPADDLLMMRRVV